MKNYLLKFALVIAACMSFVACQEDDIETKVDCTLEASVAFDKADKEGRKVTLIAPVLEDATYQWFINDEEIEAGSNKSQFLHVFEGEETKFDICVFVTKNGCVETNRACEVYEIQKMEDEVEDENLDYNLPTAQDCDLPLDFTIEKIGDQKVKLTVLEDPKDSGYVWTVSGQTFETSIGEFIYNDAQDGDEFCLFVETPDCPKGKQVCVIYEKVEKVACADFLLTIKNAMGTDITVNVINEAVAEEFTFAWKVTNLMDNFIVTGNQNDHDANSILWGVNLGVTEFCYTVFTDECKEGITKCVTMELTDLQVDKANTPVDGKLPAIGIKKLENGSYTLDIEEL